MSDDKITAAYQYAGGLLRDNPMMGAKEESAAKSGFRAGAEWQAKQAQRNEKPHASLEVMGNIQVDEGGELQSYGKALVVTFETVEDIRAAINAGQCTFSFKEDGRASAPGSTETARFNSPRGTSRQSLRLRSRRRRLSLPISTAGGPR